MYVCMYVCVYIYIYIYAGYTEKTHHAWRVFSKPCTKLTLHCNHRSGHLKTEHTESLFLLRRHLGNWPRSKHEKRTAGSAWETWTVAAADGVRCARVRWEINFLLTFETAPFFCVYPVFTLKIRSLFTFYHRHAHNVNYHVNLFTVKKYHAISSRLTKYMYMEQIAYPCGYKITTCLNICSIIYVREL